MSDEPAPPTEAGPTANPSSAPRVRARRPREDDEPATPVRAPDDSDVGWGENPRENRDEWYRSERPPHWE
jgi:hypothetical protein